MCSRSQENLKFGILRLGTLTIFDSDGKDDT